MINELLKEILSVLNQNGLGLIFFINLCLSFALFLSSLFALKFAKNRLKSLKVFYGAIYLCLFGFLIGISCLDTAFSVTEKVGLNVIFLSGIGVFSLPVFLKKEKAEFVSENQRNLIKETEQKITRNEEVEQKISVEDDDYEEINFSHVKNVISRLKFYPVTTLEKREINELSYLIKRAGEVAPDSLLKSKINEKLTSLLKIMAKYNA